MRIHASSVCRAIGLAFAVILLAATPALAQQVAEPPADPFTRHATSLEFGTAVMPEAWNYNESREWLFEGSGSMWWVFKKGFAVGIELQQVRVFQKTPDAWVQGFSPLFRWRYLERPAWNAYLEVGPGISWSDRPTPPRGTLFNYLFQSETGVMRRLTASTHAVAAFRFLHLSNNGREGITHNPDIEALGLRLGVAIWF
jgi:hypothetical protein